MSSETKRRRKALQADRVWQRMLSGRRLDLLSPGFTDIDIRDIALGLSRVARWNGQTEGDYAFSVAQHSLLVEKLIGAFYPAATPKDRLMALLHDAPEYVVGDLISPFKQAVGIDYKTFETRLLQVIYVGLGLPGAMSDGLREAVKKADQAAAYLEATQLAGFSAKDALLYFGEPAAGRAIPLVAEPPEMVRAAFLQRFHDLDAAATQGKSAAQ